MFTFYNMLLATLAALVPLVAGLILGLLIARRTKFPVLPAVPDVKQAQRVLEDLFTWVNTLVGDVDQCRERMASLHRSLEGLTAEHHAPLPLAELVSEMAATNQLMQKRLTAAESALAREANKIAGYLNEARTDALTGLPNRRFLDEELGRRHAEFRRYGVKYSVLIIDIDHFKKFNDDHGHLAGDDVIRGVAAALRRTMRETDVVARMGGEEFAAVLTLTEACDGQIAAERLRRAVEEAAYNYDGQTLHVTVSCGLTQPLPEEDLRDVFKRADIALYASKHAGRNCGHWHDGETCHRILPATPSVALPKTALEESQGNLRERLLQFTGR